MLVVLPLLLLVLGGAVDFSRSLADRAGIIEIARTTARAASRSWVIDQDRIAKNAERAVERYLREVGYDLAHFTTDVQLLELPLGGNRYTMGVRVTVTAQASLRPYHFLPGPLLPTTSGTGFYRLENARVLIKESES